MLGNDCTNHPHILLTSSKAKSYHTVVKIVLGYINEEDPSAYLKTKAKVLAFGSLEAQVLYRKCQVWDGLTALIQWLIKYDKVLYH